MAQRAAVPPHAARKAAHARAGGPGLAVLLTLLVAMGPVSTDLYLPSLPASPPILPANEGLAQLTIGLFVAGFGVMMLVCGPFADQFGRRPVLLGGMALYTLASIACALAPDIASLLTPLRPGARRVRRSGRRPRHRARPVRAARCRAHPWLHVECHGTRAAGRSIHRRLARRCVRLAGRLWALALYGGLLMAALALRLGETLRTPLAGALLPASCWATTC